MMTDLLDPPAVADLLGVPEATLAQWRYLGRGPAYFRVGRHIRYSRAGLATYLESVRVDPAATVA
jgi:hypothetical protein